MESPLQIFAEKHFGSSTVISFTKLRQNKNLSLKFYVKLGIVKIVDQIYIK